MTVLFAVSFVSMHAMEMNSGNPTNCKTMIEADSVKNDAELAARAEKISSQILEALVIESIVEAQAVVNKSMVKKDDVVDNTLIVRTLPIKRRPIRDKSFDNREDCGAPFGYFGKTRSRDDKPQLIRFHNDGLHSTFTVPKWLDDSSNK